MYNKQLGLIRAKASQAQVMFFWDRTVQASQGEECGGYKGPQEIQGLLNTILEPYLCFTKPNWHQWPKPIAGEEWNIQEPWSCHFISLQVCLSLAIQEGYEGGPLCDQGLSLLIPCRASFGLGCLCARVQAAHLKTHCKVWTLTADIHRRNKGWALRE